ncbi:adenylyltransferase/cytidyltransferase family protein [archaeon]|nr:adenylyltransferase/cytidyltransferase family protein [archaeon]MBT6762401.1 adenylyltransferase/cytidyltransferase family protein [archaeon]
MNLKKVYVGMTGDLIHPGIINIIKHAREYGQVIVGLVSDEGVAKYKRLPAMPFNARKNVIEHIKGVVEVVKQDTIDYIPNLKKIKPDYVVHGDIWRTTQPIIRKQVIETIKKWGGEVIEIPYSKGYSSNSFHHYLKKIGTTKEVRQERLKRLLESKQTIRFLGAHDGLSATIVENANMRINFSVEEFDGIWLSSRTSAVNKGISVNIDNNKSEMNDLIYQVLENTTKPIIVDCDQITNITEAEYISRTFERFGVSAIVLSENNNNKISEIISKSKKAQVTDDFMLFIKIENYKDVQDMIQRVQSYINSGADGIMIQINSSNKSNISEFCKQYQELKIHVPLITSSTTKAQMDETEHKKFASNIIVYEDQLLKSVIGPMEESTKSILINQNCNESDKKSTSMSEIISSMHKS